MVYALIIMYVYTINSPPLEFFCMLHTSNKMAMFCSSQWVFEVMDDVFHESQCHEVFQMVCSNHQKISLISDHVPLNPDHFTSIWSIFQALI